MIRGTKIILRKWEYLSGYSQVPGNMCNDIHNLVSVVPARAHCHRAIPVPFLLKDGHGQQVQEAGGNQWLPHKEKTLFTNVVLRVTFLVSPVPIIWCFKEVVVQWEITNLGRKGNFYKNQSFLQKNSSHREFYNIFIFDTLAASNPYCKENGLLWSLFSLRWNIIMAVF